MSDQLRNKEVLTTREMQELFGDALEAKMELVSVGDRMYRREGRVWRRLDGGDRS